MDLSSTLHSLAGVGALVLGAGVLLREPGRARHRAFALLCAAFTVWNLGFVAFTLSGQQLGWRMALLVGSCAAGPLGLNFALVLAESAHARRRRFVILAAIPAVLLWSAGWTLSPALPPWQIAATAVVGGTLAAAVWVIGRRARSLPSGPERRAMWLVFWGGVIVTLGGVSDFVRTELQWIQLGPPSLLLFLLILCAVTVRHRFLDLGSFILRSVALLAGAAAVALVFLAVLRVAPDQDRYLVLLPTSLAVLAVAGPLGRMLLSRARALFVSQDPLASVLVETSRRLSLATGRELIWNTLRDVERELPGEGRLEVYVADSTGGGFNKLSASGEPAGVRIDTDAPLPGWLRDEGLPITRRYLERELADRGGSRRESASRALDQLIELGGFLAVPLQGSEGMSGWFAVVGELPERYLTADLAAAFVALAGQATAGIERARALEEARRKEALAVVGELAAGLAHEIRNPLAAIRGAAQALAPEADVARQREMLAVIDEESDRLGRFLGEFLEYARPRAPRCRPVDIESLIRQSVKRMDVAGLKIPSDLESAVDRPLVSGDPEQLSELVDNLLRNAYEAAGGDGHLRITIAQDDPRRLTLRFTDDGPGVPAGDLPKLFQPFYTTKPGGTGLGLAIAHRVVQAHGGEIRVSNRSGGGAELIVLLPVARDHRE